MIDLLQNNDLEERWSEAVVYANRAGGIIPWRTFSVMRGHRTYVVKAHWGRGAAACVLSLLGVFHFLPLILPMVVPSHNNHGMADRLPLAFFGLLFTLAAARISLRVGRVVFDQERSEIRMAYGTILRLRKLVILMKDVTPRVYMFKADKGGVRLRYGEMVVALTRHDKPGSELIIGKTKSEKALARIAEEPEACFDEKVAREYPNDAEYGVSPLVGDIDKEWDRLARTSQKKRPFMGNLFTSTSGPVVKEYAEQIEVRGRVSLIAILLALAFGFLMVVMPVLIAISEGRFDYVLILFFIGMSLVGLVPAYLVLAATNTIRFDQRDDKIYVRFGYRPFTRGMVLPRDGLAVRLYRCTVDEANSVRKPGQIVLALVRREQVRSELVLSANDKEAGTNAVFHALASVIEDSSTVGLSEAVELTDDVRIAVETIPVSGGEVEGKKRRLCIIDDGAVAFKGKWELVAVFAFLSVMALIPMRMASSEKGPDGVLLAIAFFSILGTMWLTAVAFFLYFLLTRCIVVDKEANILKYSAFAKRGGRGRTIMKLSDILAVQLCSVYTSVQSGNSRRGTMVYEINLVRSHPEKKKRRVTVACGEEPLKMASDAVAFAEFLAVPLLDHTATR